MKPLLLSLLFATAAALAPAADTPSIAGKWNIHSSISGYEGDLDCAFSQNEKEVSGTCKGEMGVVDVTGRVDEKNVTLQYKTDYNGDELTLVYTGTLESPAKFAGTVRVEPMAVEGDFTAAQSK